MATLTEIKEFLEPKKMAFAGASRNPEKFGAIVFKELKSRGFDLVPIHPEANMILNVPCRRQIQELPTDVENLYIVTPSANTLSLLKASVGTHIKKVWIQQSSETEEALAFARQNNLIVISKKCILMFAEPVKGFHNFHRWLTKVTGSYPKMA
jgi:predicted CoA-binding protein